jgi:hypothetical protein
LVEFLLVLALKNEYFISESFKTDFSNFAGTMKNLIISTIILSMSVACSSPKNEKNTVDAEVTAPIFIDPNYHGSCDPEIVWNSEDNLWYIYYTARRPALQNTWLQTPLGVAVSSDMENWEFKGYCKFDGIGGKKDSDESFWAPAIISHGDKLHMFVTWKPDTIPTFGPWGGPGKIVHYEAPLSDPINGWKKVGIMHGDDLNTIDATVYRNEETFYLWFKGKKAGTSKNELYKLASSDLYSWEEKGFTKSDVFNESVTGSGFEEAPYIFRWKDKMWMITDPHMGLFVYSSEDGEDWKFQGTILKEAGSRNLDNSIARHCSAAVVGERAFIFYHVEPWRLYDSIPIYKQALENRRSVLQMAELKWIDGKISCDRDADIIL